MKSYPYIALHLRPSRDSGVAAVEFLISVPVFMLLGFFFWDIATVAIVQIRHESAAVQLALNFQASPLRASLEPARRGEEIVVQPLDGSAVANQSETGFLDSFNTLFNNILDNAGTGANLVDHNIGLRLVYLCIFSPSDTAPAPGCTSNLFSTALTPGQAYATILPIVEGLPVKFHSAPGPLAPVRTNSRQGSCFDLHPDAEARLDQYAESQISNFINESATRPIGSLSLDIISADGGSGSGVQEYIRYKPVLFWVMCSRPPFVQQERPVLSFGTHFFAKEVAYQ